MARVELRILLDVERDWMATRGFELTQEPRTAEELREFLVLGPTEQVLELEVSNG